MRRNRNQLRKTAERVEHDVDGAPVVQGESVAYKGIMLCGVPNLAMTFGYTNASWTLKADLVADYVCRLLRHMDDHGYRWCMPHNDDPTVIAQPFIDFSSGYIQRSIDTFPPFLFAFLFSFIISSFSRMAACIDFISA